MKKTILTLLAAIAVSAHAGDITGAGASFPAPVYAKWASEYNKATGVQINYQSIGSGGGIKQINKKIVDFGASDEAVKQDDLDKNGQIQFPMVKGGVVAVINLKGVETNQINLSSKMLSDIFDGVVTTWNQVDKSLPNTKIVRVVRADSSGTTSVFTHYLSKQGSKLQPGKSVKWEGNNVVSGKGNAGVAAMVQQVNGSIGYVEYAYTKQNSLTVTKLDGVEASYENFKSGKYKMTAETYIIVYPNDGAKAAIKFFDWCYTNGDQLAKDLDYVPLSDESKSQTRALWKKHGLQ